MNKESSDDPIIKIFANKAKYFVSEGYRTKWWYIANKALSDWALLNLVELKNKDVLNIGCFEPVDELIFAKQTRSWTAIDLSKEVIFRAREIVDNELSDTIIKKINFIVADMRELPFGDETFDLVTSFSTIEHLETKEDREKSYKEMVRVTKKGGYIILTTSNWWCLPYWIWSWNARRKGKTNYGSREAFYSPISLHRLEKRYGLKHKYLVSNFQIQIPYIEKLSVLFKYFGCRMGVLSQKPK